ncbi:hypothetical protein KAW18_13430 [candidate division WOR-3 bacterium]|jgi:hypothetical protein|nr:hypothetical protein [candidate division WOR-3 bacterium]
MKIIELVAKEIYHQFPDRIDRRLSIGDCTPSVGSCSGHPGGSHSGCNVLDINYYTKGLNNTTHYRPGKKENSINKVTKIWKGNTLLTEVFDWERTYFFMKRLFDIYSIVGNTKTQIRVNTTILNCMKNKVKEKYGYKAFYGDHITGDSIERYNHDIHAHISLSKMVAFP